MFDLSSKSFNHPDSGVCSPPLWTTTSPSRTNHQSKAQVIARGQRELMEMVSKMPESCYELSLKDLVEVNNNNTEENNDTPKRKKKPSKVVSKNNNGFLLKLVFPVSFDGGKRKITKKKINDDGCSVMSKRSSLVSPRGSVSDNKDCWWKNDDLSETRRINSESSKSSGSSSRSNSDRNRRSLRDENNGCLSFLSECTFSRMK